LVKKTLGMNMAEAPIRVLAVDDHPLMRHGIAAVVDAEPDMRVIAEAKDGLDAIDQCGKHRPDVVLMDVRMPRLDGIRAATALREEFPEVRVMMLATHSGDLQERLALRAGASGYLLKSAMRRDLVHAIRDLNRNSAGRRSWGHHRDAVNDESILTMRELEVLEAIAAG
jgi:two-component system NarL family response regulator